ncbi:MAG: ECF transporter S component [Clostridia bacterium]|nr:ECF transporter S component [Clostridia bacterium]
MSQRTKQLSLIALLTALLVVLGLVNIPMPAGLSITFNMIPVAIAAIAMGVPGGALMGGIFGLISFLQCFGILGFSGMGAALVSFSPFMMFVQRVLSRVLMGVLTALVWRAMSRRANLFVSCTVTGFASAFFNTLFFMSALVLLFGSTEYLQNLMAGRSALSWIVAAVGVNGLVEMAVAALVTGAVGPALKKARLLG